MSMRIPQLYILISSLVIASMLSCGVQSTREIVLVKDGDSLPIIVDLGSYSTAEAAVAASTQINWFDENHIDDTICTTALAALELRQYLCAILDKNSTAIPIFDDNTPTEGPIICVGEPSNNALYKYFNRQISKRWKRTKSRHPEGFRIDTFDDEDNEMILLSGRTRVGTLYAVYDFLERLGVRWYGPGKQGEHVPHYTDIILPPTARYEEPAMDIRGFWIEPIQFEGSNAADIREPYDRGNADFYTWMGRNRINYFWNREKAWTELKLRGVRLNCGGSNSYRLLLNPIALYPYNHPKFKGDEDRVADPYPSSPEYLGDADSNGILTYSEAHPEWFGMDEHGKRFFPTDHSGINICTSNEYGSAEFCKNVVRKLKDGEWYNADIYDFWPLDPGKWCQCEHCKTLGNDTDKMLNMLYKIRKAIQSAHTLGELNRDVQVFTAANQQTWLHPTKRLPKDFDYDNIAVVFYPKERCFNHTFADPTCTEVNQILCSHLESWFAPKCPYKGDIYVGEYYTRSGYCNLPIVLMSNIACDLPFYSNLGVNGMYYMHTATSQLGICVLLNYQFAKQLWNPFLDTNTLLTDFFDNYYSGVSVEMHRFYIMMEEVMANVQAWRSELTQRIRAIASGDLDQPLMPLEKFKDHFHIEEYFPKVNDGVDWERTYQLIHEARYVLDGVIRAEVDDVVLDRLVEDDRHFRYGEMIVRVYDNLIRLLTLGEDEPEMRTEALIRLKQYSKEMAQFKIHLPTGGISDGLQASGLKQAVEALLQRSNHLP
jgi:hypothetical protein